MNNNGGGYSKEGEEEAPPSPSPFGTLISPSPGTQNGDVDHRRPRSFLRGVNLNPENSSTLNPFGLAPFDFDRTLEGSFSRLTVNPSNNDQQRPYLGLNSDHAGMNGGPRPFVGPMFRQSDYQFHYHPPSSPNNGGYSLGNAGLKHWPEVGRDWKRFTLDSYPRNAIGNGQGLNSYSRNGQGLNFNDSSFINSGQLARRRREGEVPNGKPGYRRTPFPNSDELSSNNYSFGDSDGVLNGTACHNNNNDDNSSLSCLSVEFVRGKVAMLAKDQHGCRILQRVMEGLRHNWEVEIIFWEVIEDIQELVCDPYGNYVVQKLVDLCSEEQRTKIILALTSTKVQLASISLDLHGTRVVQKLVTNLTNELQIFLVTRALSPWVVDLAKNTNSHHVIQDCVKKISVEYNEDLLNKVANNFLDLAMDKCACIVLQSCVAASRGLMRRRLVTEIIENALLLSEDPYGNYVVQHLLSQNTTDDPEIKVAKEDLLKQFEGCYMALSLNKYASHVVEKCLNLCEAVQANKIIEELLGNPNVSRLLIDPYGNYVMQSALLVSQGENHKKLKNLVKDNRQMLQNNLYGKSMVVEILKKEQQQQLKMTTGTRPRRVQI